MLLTIDCVIHPFFKAVPLSRMSGICASGGIAITLRGILIVLSRISERENDAES